MRSNTLLVALLLRCAAAGSDCPDGKCSQEECAEKFGSSYEILVDSPPTKKHGDLTLKVKYMSNCPAGSAAFTAKVMPPHTKEEEAEGGTALLAEQKVIYVHRADAECASPMPLEQEVVEVVTTKLPVVVDVAVGAGNPTPAGTDKYEYIAFPPGGVYDMMKL